MFAISEMHKTPKLNKELKLRGNDMLRIVNFN